MTKTLRTTALSLLALVLGSTHAHAETPLDFAPPTQPELTTVPNTTADTIAINFDPPPATIKNTRETNNPPPQTTNAQPVTNNQNLSTQNSKLKTQNSNPSTTTPHPTPHTPSPDDIFSGGSNSLVARTVGSAEGTRTPEGHKTPAYHGHTDPGNGVWNLGSFSYQHEAANPEDADAKQLDRLTQQDQSLQQKAIALGIPEYETDLTVRLNGIDLANQSPLAALADDGGGYVDRLKQAQDMGLIGSEAVLWARVRSYLDPDTNQWNAPGLGNTVENISHDQQRRMDAINQAFAVYQSEVAAIAQKPTPKLSQEVKPDITEQIIAQNLASEGTANLTSTENRADQIISQAPASSDRPIAFDLAPPAIP